MEQALGHVTYARNLRKALDGYARLDPVWLTVDAGTRAGFGSLPGIRRNWAVAGSVQAYEAVRATQRRTALAALFFHTQSIALLSPWLTRTTPTIISLDATPLNYDSIGAHYGHEARPGSPAERLKHALYRRVFQSASCLMPWTGWVRDSLCRDYGVDPDLTTVVPPGVDLSLFAPPQGLPRHAEGPIRVLFVGGDFDRKGGQLLLDCMRDGLAEDCELHIVTRDPVPPTPGIQVYHNLGPNDPRLLALYQTADVFALPTYADCLGIALVEAMAAGLPAVSTTVGAVPEIVEDGGSGILVGPGDGDQLGRALRRLARDRRLRERMGRRSRELAEQRFNVRRTVDGVASAIASGIERWHQRRSIPARDTRGALR